MEEEDWDADALVEQEMKQRESESAKPSWSSPSAKKAPAEEMEAKASLGTSGEGGPAMWKRPALPKLESKSDRIGNHPKPDRANAFPDSRMVAVWWMCCSHSEDGGRVHGGVRTEAVHA